MSCFLFILFVETAIFMMEFGSAIILLSSNPTYDVWTTISAWLSVTCGVYFLLYLNVIAVHKFQYIERTMYRRLIYFYEIFITQLSPSYLLFILFEFVILSDKNQDDDGLSGAVKWMTWFHYGYGSLVIGTTAFALSLYLVRTNKP